MAYKITFDTSSDRHSAVRKSIKAQAAELAARISGLQADGRVIVSVTVI